MISLNDVPNEVLSYILAQCTLKDTCILEKVCKKFKNLIACVSLAHTNVYRKNIRAIRLNYRRLNELTDYQAKHRHADRLVDVAMAMAIIVLTGLVCTQIYKICQITQGHDPYLKLREIQQIAVIAFSMAFGVSFTCLYCSKRLKANIERPRRMPLDIVQQIQALEAKIHRLQNKTLGSTQKT